MHNLKNINTISKIIQNAGFNCSFNFYRLSAMVFGVIVTAQYQHMMDNDGWCDLNISIQNLTLFHFLLYILSFKRKIKNKK